MKTKGNTRFSDGTICDYCSNIILTKIGLNYQINNKVFCCKECADDFQKLNNDFNIG